MRWFKRIVLGVLAAVVVLLLAVVGLQVWYRFTPVDASAEAKGLVDKAAKLPTLTDNGYRLYGIEAPQALDATEYGRCQYEAYLTQRKTEAELNDPIPAADKPETKAAYDAYWAVRGERAAKLYAACRKGGTTVQLPKVLTDAKINLNTTRDDLARIAGIRFEPVLLGRAEQVWAGDARRLGTGYDAPIPMATPLVAIERWRVARAAVAWDAGDRVTAVNAWANTIRNWVKSADDSLIDSMISVNVLMQTLIAMQQSAALSPSLDEATANALLAALTPMEAMPHAVSDSLLAEWQSVPSLADAMERGATVLDHQDTSVPVRLVKLITRVTFDRNDTMNRLAKSFLWSQRAVREAAQGGTPSPMPAEWSSPPCEGFGDIGYACLAFGRNPVGRIGSIIATPYYNDYGVRVADLMTLVNATRLTVRARQLGLTGSSLEKWVAEAPADMRDRSGKQPFAYDAAARRLRATLATRNPVLGDKGSYALPL